MNALSTESTDPGVVVPSNEPTVSVTLEDLLAVVDLWKSTMCAMILSNDNEDQELSRLHRRLINRWFG